MESLAETLLCLQKGLNKKLSLRSYIKHSRYEELITHRSIQLFNISICNKIAAVVSLEGHTFENYLYTASILRANNFDIIHYSEANRTPLCLIDIAYTLSGYNIQ